MYTIKQASVRAGISVPLLRQWERRYGVVRPARTPTGYRVYDDADIAHLQGMRALVEDGWSPRNAAEAIRESGRPAVRATQSVVAAGLPWERVDQDVAQAFVGAARALDTPAMDGALDEMFVRGSFEQVAERFLAPALREIGAMWAEGRTDVAVEHVASHAILHRLGAAYQAAGRSAPGGRPIVVGLPPGSRHELGVLAFSIAARRSGLPTLYLGADLPVQDWINAVRQTHAVAAVIGVSAAMDAAPAGRVATALRAAFPDVRVAFGGPASADLVTDDRQLKLPDGLAAAVHTLRDALAADDPEAR